MISTLYLVKNFIQDSRSSLKVLSSTDYQGVEEYEISGIMRPGPGDSYRCCQMGFSNTAGTHEEESFLSADKSKMTQLKSLFFIDTWLKFEFKIFHRFDQWEICCFYTGILRSNRIVFLFDVNQIVQDFMGRFLAFIDQIQ